MPQRNTGQGVLPSRRRNGESADARLLRLLTRQQALELLNAEPRSFNWVIKTFGVAPLRICGHVRYDAIEIADVAEQLVGMQADA